MTMLPYPLLDTFLAGANSLEFHDIIRLGQVCTQNAAFAKHPLVIKKLFETAGIPKVIGESTFEAIKTLYPITITRASIQRYFGRMLDLPPSIDLELFNRLDQPDPAGGEGTIKDNYIFVVAPFLIEEQAASERTLSNCFKGTMRHLYNCPVSNIQGWGRLKDHTAPSCVEVYLVKKIDPAQMLAEQGMIRTPSRVQLLYAAIVGEQTGTCPGCGRA
jgi:hypothetical protein